MEKIVNNTYYLLIKEDFEDFFINIIVLLIRLQEVGSCLLTYLFLFIFVFASF